MFATLLNGVTANGDGPWVPLPVGLWVLTTEIAVDGTITLQGRRSSTGVVFPITDQGALLTLSKTSGPCTLRSGGWEVMATLAGRTAGAVTLTAAEVTPD